MPRRATQQLVGRRVTISRSSRTVATAIDNSLNAPPPPVPSDPNTPLSSDYPSTYASEAELDVDGEIDGEVDGQVDEHVAKAMGALTLVAGPAEATGEASAPPKPLSRLARRKQKPFPFLELPAELRVKIYEYFFDDTHYVLDLDPDNYRRIHKKLGFFRTCRTISLEAGYLFYSTHTFRIFPTHPGKHFKTKKPLLARMSSRQRSWITSLEMRLGPGWNKPPRGWVVNPALGLHECTSVRKLTVFVECDPSDGIFNGFRRADDFYEGFSRNLLTDVLNQMPSLDNVTFDAWSSVRKKGAMMRGLINTAVSHGKQIQWGPERGWTDEDNEEDIKVPTSDMVATALLNGVGMDVVIVA
ncbi:hypothetical protein B0T20DRAFT_44257 [Sordaria brevicollis]|uniref:Uncharacterized protein n=1 Tax=Sordaria brevicollis TaxID=83679 RepID=A0AAE0P9E2_SORBR|nr:hypothetical protein B0T20DRAFT_44257 [Sordaria brevicollis]